MTDEEVLDAALTQGFDLIERVVGEHWVWGWARRDDERWPCYLERRQAINWMADRIDRVAVFA